MPPTRKYQSEGGPGLREILDLRQGGDSPEQDIATLLRANIVFWLLGGTDGHGKNFSIFLTPGEQYRMTPLYDVLSAQPSLDANQVQRKNIKLAMAIGNNRHYRMDDIVPRHFAQTAALAKVGAPPLATIFGDLAAHAERWTQDVVTRLPPEFPEEMVRSVADGIAHRVRMIDHMLSLPGGATAIR